MEKSNHLIKKQQDVNQDLFMENLNFLLLSFLSLYKKNKFPVTVLRPYQIYGPAQDTNRLIPITISSCLKNKTFHALMENKKRFHIH